MEIGDLARDLGGDVAMGVEGGGDVEGGGVVAIHGRNAGLDEVAGVPEFGAFVHVLVQPLVAHWELEFLDQEGQLGVERS